MFPNSLTNEWGQASVERPVTDIRASADPLYMTWFDVSEKPTQYWFATFRDLSSELPSVGIVWNEYMDLHPLDRLLEYRERGAPYLVLLFYVEITRTQYEAGMRADETR